jgi:hypothetical protein
MENTRTTDLSKPLIGDVERVEAGDVEVGDWIAESRLATFRQVEGVYTRDVSVWLRFAPNGSRIRPRRTKRLWRVKPDVVAALER